MKTLHIRYPERIVLRSNLHIPSHQTKYHKLIKKTKIFGETPKKMKAHTAFTIFHHLVQCQIKRVPRGEFSYVGEETKIGSQVATGTGISCVRASRGAFRIVEIRNNFSVGPVAPRGCFTSGINHRRARECEWAELHGTTTVHHKFDTCSLWWLGR